MAVDPAGRSAELSVEGLVKRFGDVVALDGVSLRIASGELLTILGPSGSGKTTLLKVVAGFETANQGRVLVDGQDITSLPPARRDIGIIFQHFNLLSAKTVWENVALPLKVAGVPAAERYAGLTPTVASRPSGFIATVVHDVAVTEGTDAQAKVSVRLEEEGRTVTGRGADTDTMVAAAYAYVNALNKLLVKRKKTAPEILTVAR